MLGVGAQEEGVRRVVEKKTEWSLDYLKKKNPKNLSVQHLSSICCVGQDSRLRAN